MLDGTGSPWFVARTLSNREKVVAAHLGGRAVEHYLPTYTRTRKDSDRKVTLESPLFPGYLFVRFSRSQQLAVVTVPGILRLLEAPGGLAAVADAEIARLREGIGRQLTILPCSSYIAGDRVRIMAGPFVGYEAVVSDSNRQRMRAVLSVGSLDGCRFSLDLDPREVELTGAPAAAARA